MSIEEKYQAACKMPSDIFEHLPTLRRYAAECRYVTELGVRTIVSTWAFLAGLKEGKAESLRLKAKGGEGEAAVPEAGAPRLVSVDMFHPRDAGGDLDEVIRLAAAEGIGFEFILADDRQVELTPTDLLFVDTWHSYEQLKAELGLHAVKAQKFIILHDTETYAIKGETMDPKAICAGLKPALDEFLFSHEGRHWFVLEEFHNCNGLMVLARVNGAPHAAGGRV
jgi:hypothetical protein